MSEELEVKTPKPLTRLFHRERVEYWALMAEIIAAIAVVLSLVFVGIQLSDSNRLAESEARNQTLEQWSEFRRSIYSDRDTAELFARGNFAPDSLDDVERMRHYFVLNEMIMVTYQMYERFQAGQLQQQRLNLGIDGLLQGLCTPGGKPQLREMREQYFPDFVEQINARIPAFEEATGADCSAPPAE